MLLLLMTMMMLMLLQSVVAVRGKDQSSMLNHKSTVSGGC